MRSLQLLLVCALRGGGLLGGTLKSDHEIPHRFFLYEEYRDVLPIIL
jgi:hypothetical protein